MRTCESGHRLGRHVPPGNCTQCEILRRDALKRERERQELAEIRTVAAPRTMSIRAGDTGRVTTFHATPNKRRR